MDIKEYVEARDKAVSGSLREFKEFSEKHNVTFQSDEIAEISYYKCRSAILTLPVSIREQADQWLTSRGYKSLA